MRPLDSILCLKYVGSACFSSLENKAKLSSYEVAHSNSSVIAIAIEVGKECFVLEDTL